MAAAIAGSCDDGLLVGEVEKNTTERIRIRLTEYRGYKLVDLRLFYQADAGEYRPTGKGFSIRRDRIGELRAALEEAERIAHAREAGAKP